MDPLPPNASTDASWASPGTVTDAPRVASVPTIFDEPRVRGSALEASPVARLQPRTVGQLLDGGFEVLRFRFRTIAIVAAAIVLPLYAVPQVLAAWAGVVATDASTVFGVGQDLSGDVWNALVLGNVARLGLMLANMLMGVALGHLVLAWLGGADPEPGDVFRFLRARLPTTLGAFVLAVLAKIGGAIVCGVGLLVVLPLLSVLGPVVAGESVSAGEAVGRSYTLAKRRFGAALGVMVLWWAASGLVGLSAQSAAGAIGGITTGSIDGAAVAVQAVAVVGTVVLTVVQSAVTVLLYVDLRVRTEGLDLELDAVERFDARG